jgi:MbtH protein
MIIEEDKNYNIVINIEEQYSIWPIYKAVPNGWRIVSEYLMSKDECLKQINTLWTDMRPLSLRKN